MRPLSLRLKSLLERCLPDLPLWDLCCDHGLLGLAALASGRYAPVYFNDVVPHVLDELRTRSLKGQERGQVIYGLAEEIAQPLLGNVVLAGIGGEKIARILQTHLANGRLQATRLVLCPEKDAEWLAAQTFEGFALSESRSIEHNLGGRWIYTFNRINSPLETRDAAGHTPISTKYLYRVSPEKRENKRFKPKRK